MSDIQFTSDISVDLIQASASDATVIRAAKVSFSDDTYSDIENIDQQRFINYLMVNRHGSPFEHGLFTFRVHAPLFVVQQMLRHRAGHSYNQESGRYHEFEPVFYVPAQFREQWGKPGAYTFRDADPQIHYPARDRYEAVCEEAWRQYQNLLLLPIAKEQARGVLPTTLMTSLWWSCNPRSLMHFLSLRLADDAQAEIREVARQAATALFVYMPITHDTFIDNGMVAP